MVFAVTGFSSLWLAFVPLAAAMVYADRIIARWADENERIYSIRDLAIMETGLLAFCCLLYWFLRLLGGQMEAEAAVWPFLAVAGFRIASILVRKLGRAVVKRRHGADDV